MKVYGWWEAIVVIYWTAFLSWIAYTDFIVGSPDWITLFAFVVAPISVGFTLWWPRHRKHLHLQGLAARAVARGEDPKAALARDIVLQHVPEAEVQKVVQWVQKHPGVHIENAPKEILDSYLHVQVETLLVMDDPRAFSCDRCGYVYYDPAGLDRCPGCPKADNDG